jgi:hypothetical protein
MAKIQLLCEVVDRKLKVDDFVELHQWYEANKDQIKKYEKLKKELLEGTDTTTDFEQQLVIVGQVGNVVFSEGRNATVIIDKAKLIRQLTQKTYNEHSTISLESLKELMSGQDLSKHTRVERSKVRSLKEVVVVEKGRGMLSPWPGK